MVTYKEQIQNRTSYVLLVDNEVKATFGNLKKLCDYVEDENFLSYWTLVRKKENPIVFEQYKIFKVKHY